MLIKVSKNTIGYIKILLKSPKAVFNNLTNWSNSLIDPTNYYLDAFRYFYFRLPFKLRAHKNYFNKNARGFGEKAFHSMWYLLYRKYQFINFLEIGVYRGQTISLVALIAKLTNHKINVYGISPFDSSGDAMSAYIQIDYLKDVLLNFEKFLLPSPNLTKAYSTDELAKKVIRSTVWDCIYIDGSHDYEVAKQDWLICSAHIKVGGIIVMDDASLFTTFNPPFFAFKGHPGPSKVAGEIDADKNFKEILRVGHNRVFEKIK